MGKAEVEAFLTHLAARSPAEGEAGIRGFPSPLLPAPGLRFAASVYGLLPACKHFTFLTVGSTAHVYPASELGSIARAIMGYSRV